jgi:hypothetical protein
MFKKAINDKKIDGLSESGYNISYPVFSKFLNARKYKNAYLNWIVRLMMGRNTKYVYGVIPSLLFSILLNRLLILFFNYFLSATKLSYDFNELNLFLARVMKKGAM